MTPASLEDIVAHKTGAQIDVLMAHHVGKSVRASGKVESVSVAGMFPQATIRSNVLLLLFFDTTEDYDPKLALLALNIGDEVIVSGQTRTFGKGFVSLENCRLIEARGRSS